ncbi:MULTISPECIES: FKBP-type peptidyl-prolyl cis-trans isomerase [unclassified Pedobacter]|uniref:FKBP-type peptidyl-prolyl cis-trans isomerase n=1 Tax=unclassified Pedobacter TaxID=2628915 RepID=UPI00141E9398|nr:MULTISPECIES: FKBP-type peptidyl-prolyl cis-trans isomerase [unclassified Pedobacter]NII85727.1 FKBP-type peptidyl-prolyl cis-trans isomerase [Pedobacter sp. SG908]NMN39355.1 FKBP-type peptidyl-prolyl cis-trans isomerase [Pedobacter sp. SG918]
MNKFTQLSLFALLLATTIFSSCKKEYESIESVDDAAIQAYLKKNNLSFDKDPKGYYYKIITSGTGDVVKNQDSVYYSYTFKTLSGQVLNQTSDLMIPGTFLGYTDRFTINNVSYVFTPIREVLTKLKRGGKATLIMPSSMAFGKNGVSFLNIGSNENILVDLGIYAESKRHEIDEFEINKFISNNNLTLIKDPSRARYSITTPGTGTDVINLNSTIVANYTVRHLDGTVLQSSTDGTFSDVLSNLYKGWQLILPGKVTAGGKLRLVIPSDLANGTPLDFDIEIVKVTN